MTVTIGRRELLAALGGAAVLAPLAASAQEPGRIYRLGVLVPTVSRQSPAVLAFFDELRHNGFVEGQNLTVIQGSFDVPNDRLAGEAAALVKAAPDAIVAGPELPLRALQAATRTIPLVGASDDMVAEGLVTSLARPGGNITGISLLSPELDGKRQDILIEAVPGARRIAAMADSTANPPYHLQVLQHGARSRGYGPRFADMYRQRARIAVKIFRGAKPADIPVEIPDRYELVINLKAAKAIGHEVPAGLVLRADKVIE